jgi:hypothetical protein
MKKPRKAILIRLASVLILSIAFYFYSRPVLVYMPSDSVGDCNWGYEAVEVSRIPFLNSQFSKFCDCSETPLFLANGNHIPCGSKEDK